MMHLSIFLGIAGLTFDIKGSWVLFITLLMASLLWSIVIYRRTLPPSGIFLRVFLGGLRFTALALLIFLIFEPSLSRQSQKVLKPLLPVIIDDSRSMNLTDASGERSRNLQRLFDDSVWNELNEQYELQIFALGDSLKKLSPDPLSDLDFNDIGTNLSSFLKSLPDVVEHESYANLILITDGGHNEGRDPVQTARETDAHIYTVGIGDTTQVKDARIASITAPEMVYRDRKAEVTVRIAAKGMENQIKQVDLIGNDDEILASGTVKLPDDELLVEQVIEFTPSRVGHLPLKVRLHGSDEEWDLENNLRSQPLEVLESRLRVLAISGSLNQETVFFHQTAGEISDFEIKPYTINQRGDIYDHQSVNFDSLLSQSDVVVLIGLPKSGSGAPALIQLKRSLSRKPLPLWVWPGSNPNLPELRRLMGDEIPVQSGSRNVSIEADIAPDRYYLILDPDSETEELPLWRNLPPIQLSGFQIETDERVESLISIKEPETGQVEGSAVFVWEAGGNRFAISIGTGYWRWSFMKQGMGETDELYRGFISKMIRWLGSNPKIKPLRLMVDKKLYSTGEPVSVTAQIRRGDGEEVVSGQVELMIEGGESSAKLVLESDQRGNYYGTFQPQELGTYSVMGTAFIGSDIAGIDSTGFLVESYNIEREALRQDSELLQSMAAASGGRYLSVENISQIIDMMEAPPRTVSVGWSRRFFLNWDLWACIILLLSLEWAIRKRRGML